MPKTGSNMVAKVLGEQEVSLIEPLLWKSAAGSRSVPRAAAQESTATKQIITTHDQVDVLQARVRELEGLLANAREVAFREGEGAGRNQTVAQVQPVLERLAKSIQELAELRGKLRHQAEGDLLKLSLAIARKVIHREISTDSEAVTGLVHVALEKIRVQDIIKVRTHPQHHAALQQYLARIANGARVTVEADQTMPMGGVVVETARGEFDASVEVQLREIERGLADRLASHD